MSIKINLKELKNDAASVLIEPGRIWFYEAYLPHDKDLESNIEEI